MKDLKEISANYAGDNTNQMIEQIVAQAFADGYRMGYKDREEENPVDLRDNKTEYVDLGLPSGTLWSADYEKKGDNLVFLPYSKLTIFKLPTRAQIQELIENCKIVYLSYQSIVQFVGHNGNVLNFNYAPYYEGSLIIKGTYFWLSDSNEGDKDVVYINAGKSNEKKEISFKKVFSGFYLPVRQVR